MNEIRLPLVTRTSKLTVYHLNHTHHFTAVIKGKGLSNWLWSTRFKVAISLLIYKLIHCSIVSIVLFVVYLFCCFRVLHLIVQD